MTNDEAKAELLSLALDIALWLLERDPLVQEVIRMSNQVEAGTSSPIELRRKARKLADHERKHPRPGSEGT